MPVHVASNAFIPSYTPHEEVVDKEDRSESPRQSDVALLSNDYGKNL